MKNITRKIMYDLRKRPMVKEMVAPAYRTAHRLKEMPGRRRIIQKNHRDFLRAVGADGPKIWYGGVPTHPNLGDQAQACCIERWLGEAYPGYSIVPVSSAFFDAEEALVLRTMEACMTPEDRIFFQSGYTLKDAHPDEHLHLAMLKRFPGCPIVFFPQSIHFRDPLTIARYHDALTEHPRCTLICRDSTSMDWASRWLPEVSCFLLPDIVTTRIGEYAFSKERKGILFCMRSDAEGCYAPEDVEALAGRYEGEGTAITDTTLPVDVMAGSKIIWQAIEELVAGYAGYRLIVTDRYHGTIFSLMAGTPVVVLATNDHKVVEGAGWLEKIYPEYVSLAGNLDEAEGLIAQALTREDRPAVLPYFYDQYYEHLREEIEGGEGRGDGGKKAEAENAGDGEWPPVDCTGCTACVAACPVGALSMVQDERGFYASCLDGDACIHCGRCREICPVGHPPAREGFTLPPAYAYIHKIEGVRLESSSGGVFRGLARAVIARGGAVYGAVLDENQVLGHRCAVRFEELGPMMGSKYVQSRMGDGLVQVQKRLAAGQPVLFVGTPCQVAGLKAFLGQDDDNLLTVDLVCHGVPSPAVFQDYLNSVKIKQGAAEIGRLSFRHKNPSWRKFSMKMVFENGAVYEEDMERDPYLRGFLSNVTLRGGCTRCPWAGAPRTGDITLGDFWSYVSSRSAFRNDQKGISLVLAHTEKGRQWCGKLAPFYQVVEKPFEDVEAGGGPLFEPSRENEVSAAFWDAFVHGVSFQECAGLFFRPEPVSRRYRLGCWVNDHTWMMPAGGREMYDRLKNGVKRHDAP